MSSSTLFPKTGGGKAQTLSVPKLVPESKQFLLGPRNAGINGERYPRITPMPFRKAREEILTDHYGAVITIGADDEYSQLGGRCTEIDMITGPLSSVTAAATNPNSYAIKSPDYDAARIRISETTNIDKVANIVEGSGNSEARSGVLLMADAIRIKSKENIKLVTSAYGDYNSKSSKVICPNPIELISGNDDSDMQPIVKGDNLVKALDNMNERIDKLYSIFQTLAIEHIQLLTVLTTHIHVGITGPVAPSIELAPFTIKNINAWAQAGLIEPITNRVNTIINEFNSLTPMGAESILGQNRTN